MSVPLSERFRGFLPVVIDVETSGLDPQKCALLELAWIMLEQSATGELAPGPQHCIAIAPFDGALIEPQSLKVSGIDPMDSSRKAVGEKDALKECFASVRREMKKRDCNRAIVVAHNAFFDRDFLATAADRQNIRRNPFHPFSTFDTSALAGLAFGQTVLSTACRRAGIDFDQDKAHSAQYDADRTARLFCQIVNRWDSAYPDLIAGSGKHS